MIRTDTHKRSSKLFCFVPKTRRKYDTHFFTNAYIHLVVFTRGWHFWESASLLGEHALLKAADRLQLSCQQADKDVGCQEVNVNTTALCLVDGHAVESAGQLLQRGVAIWLLGDLYDWHG
jgi:hypothetical protein